MKINQDDLVTLHQAYLQSCSLLQGNGPHQQQDLLGGNRTTCDYTMLWGRGGKVGGPALNGRHE